MRRQMQLRPSQGGKFRGPVGAPLPEENPAKAALARLPWPLSLAESWRRKVPAELFRQACADGYIDPHPTLPQWDLTEEGAALLGVKPPGFREEFAEAGRNLMDAIKREEQIAQWASAEIARRNAAHEPETNWLRAGWGDYNPGDSLVLDVVTAPPRNTEIDIGGPPFPTGDAKPVRYDPVKPIPVAVGHTMVVVVDGEALSIMAETNDLYVTVFDAIVNVRRVAREWPANGLQGNPPGWKAACPGFLVHVSPIGVHPGGMLVDVEVRRI